MEHNIGFWIGFLVIGGIIGWLAGLITRGRGFGILGDIVVGVVGAMVGGWLASLLGLFAASSLGAFLVALVGAVILVGLTRFIKRVA